MFKMKTLWTMLLIVLSECTHMRSHVCFSNIEINPIVFLGMNSEKFSLSFDSGNCFGVNKQSHWTGIA